MTETNLPTLLTDESIEYQWAIQDPKGIAARITKAREEGYVGLTPFQRQFAMEFVLSGNSLKRIARMMQLPQPLVQRMYNDPVTRAYISDLQKEIASQRIINDQWVENQIMKNLPKLLGEEPVDIVTSKGTHVKKKKYHGAELVSLFKHFSSQELKDGVRNGNAVNVQINFKDILSQPPQVSFNLDGSDDQ